jgi:hypothetical protein
MLHQIQRILADRVVFAPIWENSFIRAFGPPPSGRPGRRDLVP